ncbi:hypothetical protein HPB50_007443 [Hyalomma asiaticum]|uniref:Uncharacterized protein n=1 Tax=Hyalomma asiaticum TaxID=266040 RepID=A0ACB7TJY5_HYAAI|nr:hypothetical protein HPB50_007443 [Hyalomma asiaticum]
MSVDEARKLEQTSRQQSQSATWRAARKDRLRASNFGVAVSREKWTEKGLQNLTTDRDLSRVRAIQYGVSSEAVAVQKYETTLRTIRHNIQTFHCGLVVDPGCPWLGASPDRVVWDPEEQEPHGIVEIKCPYSMKDLKEPFPRHGDIATGRKRCFQRKLGAASLTDGGQPLRSRDALLSVPRLSSSWTLGFSKRKHARYGVNTKITPTADYIRQVVVVGEMCRAHFCVLRHGKQLSFVAFDCNKPSLFQKRVPWEGEERHLQVDKSDVYRP